MAVCYSGPLPRIDHRYLPPLHIECRALLFHDPPTPQSHPLSLHDALPISSAKSPTSGPIREPANTAPNCRRDRKSTRLNSSHVAISYAVFCLKKKNIVLIRETGRK